MSDTKILVVEDESIVAMDIKHRAESLGYTVTGITPSGEEAIQKVSEDLPDLVLMDIVLKGEMDGVEAAQKIRDSYDIPVVYLTAYSDERTLKRAKVTEPFGYIIKPFEDRELHSAVEVALYKHKMESKLKESEKWLSTTLESIGDAVIATDNEGKIKFMNPVAMLITGWEQEEAFGKSLKEVFNTVDEFTGLPLEDPVTSVVQNNITVESNQPKLLVTKNGDKIPIDDSSAPIRDNGDILGVALIFKDITERRKAEKEREQLLKEKARGELSSFVLSALPLFASNIPPQIRNNIARNFSDRFEKNVKHTFHEELKTCSEGTPKDEEIVFKCYSSWLSEFLDSLGLNSKITSKGNRNYLTLENCPWILEDGTSPMFCLICRAIVLRSFTWTDIGGNVEQTACLADGAGKCKFEFIFSH